MCLVANVTSYFSYILSIIGNFILSMKRLCDYRIARKFRGVKFSRKLIRLSFNNLIFADSDPIAIISDVNIVLQIKIFASRDKFAKTAKILSNFLAIR